MFLTKSIYYYNLKKTKNLIAEDEFKVKVAKLRRESDNAETDFFNNGNNTLMRANGETLSSWSGIVSNPTYDWNFRELSGPNIKYIKIDHVVGGRVRRESRLV